MNASADWLKQKAALYTQPDHRCENYDGGGAYWLEPPHRGSNGKVAIGDGRFWELRPDDGWTLHLDMESAPVRFCPWCGEELPTSTKQEG